MKSYYAAGKVMLIGEYAVKLGIEALALPVRKGQHLRVWEYDSPSEDSFIYQAYDNEGARFVDLQLKLPFVAADFESSDDSRFIRQTLAFTPPSFWKEGKSYRFETQLEFDRSSGWGSSSTFVALWAKATGMDAQPLQQALLGGSGYDVAVAELGKPLVFWIREDQPHWDTWSLNPDWTQEWMLLNPGKKVDSRKSMESVAQALEAMAENPFMMGQLQKMVDALKNAGQKAMLESGLEWWQALLASQIGLPTPYQQLNLSPVKGGLCKWLGAWGGDTLLVNRTFYEAHKINFEAWQSWAWNDIVINE
jgi:mevalonate kinase